MEHRQALHGPDRLASSPYIIIKDQGHIFSVSKAPAQSRFLSLRMAGASFFDEPRGNPAIHSRRQCQSAGAGPAFFKPTLPFASGIAAKGREAPRRVPKSGGFTTESHSLMDYNGMAAPLRRAPRVPGEDGWMTKTDL